MDTTNHCSTSLHTTPPPNARRAGPTRRVVIPVVPLSPSELLQGDSGRTLGAFLSVNETAKKINRSRSWLYGAMRSGDFPEGIYQGRNMVFPEAWVDAWMAKQVERQLDLGDAQ